MDGLIDVAYITTLVELNVTSNILNPGFFKALPQLPLERLRFFFFFGLLLIIMILFFISLVVLATIFQLNSDVN